MEGCTEMAAGRALMWSGARKVSCRVERRAWITFDLTPRPICASSLRSAFYCAGALSSTSL